MGERASRSRRSANPPGVGPLEMRTVTVCGETIQIRLEPSFWEGLEDISKREGLTLDDLLDDLLLQIDEQSGGGERSGGQMVANAIRVFVVGYFRQAATESGHDRAGHGRGDPFVATPFDRQAKDGVKA